MEAEAVVDMIIQHYPDMKFWVSFQCKVRANWKRTSFRFQSIKLIFQDSTSLASGEKFAEAVRSIWSRVQISGSNNCVAIGANCLQPNFVATLMEPIGMGIPLIAYPNSGESYFVISPFQNHRFVTAGEMFDMESGWQGKDGCIPLENYVEEWIKLGVKFIGGCCRTTADDIKNIKAKIVSLKK